MSKEDPMSRADIDYLNEVLRIVMAREKAAKTTKPAAPNQGIKDLAAALAHFPDMDESAVLYARTLLKCKEFEGRKYHTYPQLTEHLDTVPENTTEVALNDADGEMFRKLSHLAERTTKPTYKGPRLRLREPHPRVITITKLSPEAEPPSFLKEMLNTKK